ncbi:MAG: hypothetical protein PHP92_05660 [Candidatus Nanoarchaeia archaeon]|jgi:hypothetical protein|nr:hypothetical protein [Candidatus Nanoarchaeia archaeon]
MKTVILCSPYKPKSDLGTFEYVQELSKNLRYARLCLLDSMKNHGEAPFLSHLLYPQVLDDNIPEERELGIEAEHAWFIGAHAVVIYMDLGVSEGMRRAIELGEKLGLKKEERKLKGWIG